MNVYWLISNLLFVVFLIAYLFFRNNAEQHRRANRPDRVKRWVLLSRLAMVVWIASFAAMVGTLAM